jgi:hypothetical protein
VSETQADLGEMKDLSSTSFGYLIAFLLPGLLGLFALSYWSNDVRSLIQPAVKADATVGPSVILMLVALAVGLCVSAIRFFIFEKMLCRHSSFPKDMFAKLSAENKLPSFKAVVDEHYRYHQFYGGIAVSLAVMFVGWAVRSCPVMNCEFIFETFGFAVFEIVLALTASDAFKRYVERGTTIVNSEVIAQPAAPDH